MTLPDVPPLSLIEDRLPIIFPDGTEHRSYLIREMAAKTIFVMFYAGAIEGSDRWVRPSQITDMSGEQSILTDDVSRETWTKMMLSSKTKTILGNKWYAPNTREPIRDETLRSGFVPLQAVVLRQGIPTTSSKPIYALQKDFSKLFLPSLKNSKLKKSIESWQKKHMSKMAISRQKILKHINSNNSQNVQINMPDGSIRNMSAGPSSEISKAVIEEFSPKFLKNPQVLWLSESGNKVVAQDEILTNSLGLNIDPTKVLPDIILVDLGGTTSGSEMLVVFTEIVATDGAITQQRKLLLSKMAKEAGFDSKDITYLTAFLDRSSQPFKKNISELAWGSFAWFASEPEFIIDLREHEGELKLTTLK